MSSRRVRKIEHNGTARQFRDFVKKIEKIPTTPELLLPPPIQIRRLLESADEPSQQPRPTGRNNRSGAGSLDAQHTVR